PAPRRRKIQSGDARRTPNGPAPSLSPDTGKGKESPGRCQAEQRAAAAARSVGPQRRRAGGTEKERGRRPPRPWYDRPGSIRRVGGRRDVMARGRKQSADLFHEASQANLRRALPLAARLRPRSLDEYVGQEHFLGPGKLLRRLLQADRLSSVIFYGPPGSGKTALAHVIAQHTQCEFREVNAAAAGIKEVRELLQAARRQLEDSGRRTILFVDELHRVN